MTSSNVNFKLTDLNVDSVTEISGLFFHTAQDVSLVDMSYNINVDVDKEKLNQIFLFFSDDTSGNTALDDLSDLSSSDLKYALHVRQWNPAIETVKSDRKHVIRNLLTDLFGGAPADALSNVDVFSNETQMDNDISNIFHTKVSQKQRESLYTVGAPNPHGAFDMNKTLGALVDASGTLNSVASTDTTAITRKLLEQAVYHTRRTNNESNTAFRRQFDASNNSNTLYNLPTGWRTFQFIENDTISFNLIIKQLSGAFPAWAVGDPTTLATGGTPTTYRVKFTIKDTGNLVSDAGGFATLASLPS
tara:strand:- start:954 stop:1865 length:912 start_codon:yes stop_codon:yes gene_type:complete